MNPNHTSAIPAESLGMGSGIKNISPTAFYSLTWIFFALCTIAFVARAYIRYVCFRRLMLEDYLMLLALAMHNVEAVLIQVFAKYAFDWEAIQMGDNSRMTPDFMPNSHQGFIAFGLCVDMSILGILIVKLTFLLFFRRIGTNTGRRFNIVWWGVVLFTIAGTVAVLAILEHQCTYGPIENTFNSEACTGVEAMRRTMIGNIFSAVQDAFSDFLSKSPWHCLFSDEPLLTDTALVISFPVVILWRSGIGMRNKLILTFIFGMVSLTIAITIVRGSVFTNLYSEQAHGHQLQQRATFTWFWMYTEFSVSIIIACVVSFRTLFVNRALKAKNQIQENQRREAFLESRARRRWQNKLRQLQNSMLETCRDLEGADLVDSQADVLAMDVPSGRMTVDFSDDTSWAKTARTNDTNNSNSIGRSISMQSLLRDQIKTSNTRSTTNHHP